MVINNNINKMGFQVNNGNFNSDRFQYAEGDQIITETTKIRDQINGLTENELNSIKELFGNSDNNDTEFILDKLRELEKTMEKPHIISTIISTIVEKGIDFVKETFDGII